MGTLDVLILVACCHLEQCYFNPVRIQFPYISGLAGQQPPHRAARVAGVAVDMNRHSLFKFVGLKY